MWPRRRRTSAGWIRGTEGCRTASCAPKELGLLEDLSGKTLLKLCCTSGQDSTSLQLRHGARCCGGDRSERRSPSRARSPRRPKRICDSGDIVSHFLNHIGRRVDVGYDLPRVARLKLYFRPPGIKNLVSYM
jgi:hypothetical protein